MTQWSHLIERAESLMTKVEACLPASTITETDWDALAWRWDTHQNASQLHPIRQRDTIALSDLLGIAQQKQIVLQNTQQFVAGYPANHVLLAGARGTGKSSLVKAMLNALSDQGLRLIEVDKADLQDLFRITQLVKHRPERFIIYCDDLSFEAGDQSYKGLKVVLDGSIEVASSNVLIYATSNRRNLVPEYMADNLVNTANEEVLPNDVIEEKASLAERFGLRLMFHACDQAAYLAMVKQWLTFYGLTVMDGQAEQAALQWSYTRGARSGRVANQFARDYVGRMQYAQMQKDKQT